MRIIRKIASDATFDDNVFTRLEPGAEEMEHGNRSGVGVVRVFNDHQRARQSLQEIARKGHAQVAAIAFGKSDAWMGHVSNGNDVQGIDVAMSLESFQLVCKPDSAAAGF